MVIGKFNSEEPQATRRPRLGERAKRDTFLMATTVFLAVAIHAATKPLEPTNSLHGVTHGKELDFIPTH